MNIHNKKISAVVSDFDGTIIKHGMSIPPKRFFTDIEKLLEKGIPFIAASGRQYANLRRILSPIAELRAVPDTEITISAENTLYLCTKMKLISIYCQTK